MLGALKNELLNCLILIEPSSNGRDSVEPSIDSWPVIFPYKKVFNIEGSFITNLEFWTKELIKVDSLWNGVGVKIGINVWSINGEEILKASLASETEENGLSLIAESSMVMFSSFSSGKE